MALPRDNLFSIVSFKEKLKKKKKKTKKNFFCLKSSRLIDIWYVASAGGSLDLYQDYSNYDPKVKISPARRSFILHRFKWRKL